MRFILTGAAVAIAALTAQPAAAEMYQFSNSVFTLPPGWTLGSRDRGFQTIYPDDSDSCSYCYFYIGRSQPAMGSLKSFVSKNKRMFVDEDDINAIGSLTPVKELRDFGYDLGMQSFTVDGKAMFMVGFQVGDRYEIVGFEGDIDDAEDQHKTTTTFEKILSGYMKSTRFVSKGAPPLMPPAQPGTLSGPYFGSSMMQTVGLNGLMQTNVVTEIFVFWPDGYFYQGTPPGGIKPLDLSQIREPVGDGLGVYRIEGDQVKLTYASGETDSLTVDDEGLVYGAAFLSPVTPLEDGATFEGTTSFSFYSGLAGNMGGFHSSSSTTFSKDGTFSAQSSSGAFGSFSDGMGGTTGGYSAGSSGGDLGRYQVKDGLVTIQSADGSAPEVELVFKIDDQIYIGGDAVSTD